MPPLTTCIAYIEGQLYCTRPSGYHFTLLWGMAFCVLDCVLLSSVHVHWWIFCSSTGVWLSSRHRVCYSLIFKSLFLPNDLSLHVCLLILASATPSCPSTLFSHRVWLENHLSYVLQLPNSQNTVTRAYLRMMCSVGLWALSVTCDVILLVLYTASWWSHMGY